MHKENFDLKLELYHRRERQSKLEGRVEVLETQIEEQSELQAINDQLLTELEKRDQAVEQAVGIIIGLEEKNDKLIAERNAVKTIHAETSFYLSDHTDGASTSSFAPDIPQLEVDDDATPVCKRTLRSKSIVRMPSFLSENTEETEALRSLYLPRDQSHNGTASRKPAEDNGMKEPDAFSEPDVMNSPRLSVLSESSFLSVYGSKGKDQDLDALDLSYGEHADLHDTSRHRKSSSVDQWVGDGLKNVTSKDRKVSGPRRVSGNAPGQFLSMNDVVKSPLQRLERLQRTLERRNKPPITGRLFERSSNRRTSDTPRSVPAKKDNIRRIDVDTFDDRYSLPPTPNTFSTSTLHKYQTSSDTLTSSGMSSQVPELEDDRPYPSRAQAGPEYAPARHKRPQSAAGTITTLRRGQGWDTATQSQLTGDNSGIGSDTTDPWTASAMDDLRPATLETPTLFSLSNAHKKDWGRDVMFHRRDSDIPIRPRKRLDSDSDHSRRDGTTVPSRQSERSASIYDREGSRRTQTPTETDVSLPVTPDRRSSLPLSPSANDKRLRRLQQAQAAAKSQSDPPTQATSKLSPKKGPQKVQDGEQPKRSLLKMFGIGRSVSAIQTPPVVNRALSRNEQRPASSNNISGPRSNTTTPELRSSRATPPPISRYPRGRGVTFEASLNPPRPSTSHSMESRSPNLLSVNLKKERRLSVGQFSNSALSGTLTNASDGTEQPDDYSVRDSASTRARKWYRMGRTASLRRYMAER